LIGSPRKIGNTASPLKSCTDKAEADTLMFFDDDFAANFLDIELNNIVLSKSISKVYRSFLKNIFETLLEQSLL